MKLSEYFAYEEISLSSESITKLERFASLLHEWNQVHNLTGAKSIDAIYANIVDSLFPLSFIDMPKSILDVGTGAGFPGLVLAIVLPDIEIILAEPLKKRVSFLKYAAIELEILNMKVEAKRVEYIDADPFELITSRAVTDTKLLLALTKNISNSGTRYLFYKGSRVFEEFSEIEHKLEYDIVQNKQRYYLYIKGQV